MKRFAIYFFTFALAASGIAGHARAQVPAAPGVVRVYVLPMAGGFDQYLAVWIIQDHIFQVVTDPKAADAVFTDRIGEAFEQKLSQIRPLDTPTRDVGKDAGKDAAAGNAAGKPAHVDDTAGAGGVHNSFRSSIARGTLFLVDAKSRQVIWSDYEKPVAQSDNNLNRQAERIARKLLPESH